MFSLAREMHYQHKVKAAIEKCSQSAFLKVKIFRFNYISDFILIYVEKMPFIKKVMIANENSHRGCLMPMRKSDCAKKHRKLPLHRDKLVSF